SRHHIRQVRCMLRWIAEARSNPHRRQQQHRCRKRHPRRRRQPRPPTLFHRLRRHTRAHPRIKRRRRLNHRQFIQQTRHRAKLIPTQPARRARVEVCFPLACIAGFQPAVHISQNPAFHPFTAHNNLLSISISVHRTSLRPNSPTDQSLPYFLTSPFHPPPTAPTPLAKSHTLGTTTTSTHSPNIPKSSRSRCSPAPDTCAAAPPPAASPAISRLRAGS